MVGAALARGRVDGCLEGKVVSGIEMVSVFLGADGFTKHAHV